MSIARAKVNLSKNILLTSVFQDLHHLYRSLTMLNQSIEKVLLLDEIATLVESAEFRRELIEAHDRLQHSVKAH